MRRKIIFRPCNNRGKLSFGAVVVIAVVVILAVEIIVFREQIYNWIFAWFSPGTGGGEGSLVPPDFSSIPK